MCGVGGAGVCGVSGTGVCGIGEQVCVWSRWSRCVAV